MNSTTAAAPPAGESAEAGDRNDADIAFAQQMIPHHAQAIEMAQLEQAEDAAFDRMFAELMIRHHQGAIDMAEKMTADRIPPCGMRDPVLTSPQRIPPTGME